MKFSDKTKTGSTCRLLWHMFNHIGHFNFRRTGECSEILRWLSPKPGEQILDIGCGDGYYDWLIARSGANVVGIDIHRKQLSKARKYYNSKSTDFLYMDAEALNFPRACFDKVISLCVIEHLADDEQVMQNIYRVLKPGGYFVFSADSLSNPGITPEEKQRHQTRYKVKTFYSLDIVRGKLSRNKFDIEETQFILDTPCALALARFSWKLDDLPKIFFIFRVLGYFVAGTIWKLVNLFVLQKKNRTNGGLTILVRARKPKKSPQ